MDDDMPEEIRMMHPNLESALDECIHDQHRERVSTVQQCQRAQQREWKLDNLKGKVLSLLREWQQEPRSTTLESRAAETVALHLFPKAIIQGKVDQESALKISTTKDLHALLQEELGAAGDHLEPARNAVVDSLVPLLISWERIQDLCISPDGPWDVNLPGFLQDHEQLR